MIKYCAISVTDAWWLSSYRYLHGPDEMIRSHSNESFACLSAVQYNTLVQRQPI